MTHLGDLEVKVTDLEIFSSPEPKARKVSL